MRTIEFYGVFYLFLSRGNIARTVSPASSLDIYPERSESSGGWGEWFWRGVASRLASRISLRSHSLEYVTEKVLLAGEGLERAADARLKTMASELREQLRIEGFQEGPVARSFALVREVASRTLGMRPFDTQVYGGWMMLLGNIVEMETGEGKTLACTLPACTAVFAGIPVHVITVNDYLASRDAGWMGPIYDFLGISVGVATQDKDLAERKAAYRRDMTYCTNKTVAFDYLRDRITLGTTPGPLRLHIERLCGKDTNRVSRLILRGLYFGIVDEADSVLVDECRTPLIIAGPGSSQEEQAIFSRVLAFAASFRKGEDFTLDGVKREVRLTGAGRERLGEQAQKAAISWAGSQFLEELLQQALVATHLFKRDRDYLVRDGKVQIIDEYTGRLMEDRSWERGLHQFIELKEGCEVTTIRETLSRISYQRFFRKYRLLAGMTGTAREVAEELYFVYGLKVVSIPTARPLRRVHLPDIILPSHGEKWNVIVSRVRDLHKEGRPVLIGTRSVADSEHLSGLLQRADLPHQVLNARQDSQEAQIIKKAGQRGQITVATNMAGRGTDIVLGPDVADLGGLHVIATERHDSGRIDRQLFGRCARQGDPGTCQAILSLEDELLVRYGGFLTKMVIGNPKLRCTLPCWLKRLLILKAQKRAERIHARIRMNLLKMDRKTGTALAFSGKME